MAGQPGAFALRLYRSGNGTYDLLCDYGYLYSSLQWNSDPSKRMTWDTAEHAHEYLTEVIPRRWPEVVGDIRVVRVTPAKREEYDEVEIAKD